MGPVPSPAAGESGLITMEKHIYAETASCQNVVMCCRSEYVSGYLSRWTLSRERL